MVRKSLLLLMVCALISGVVFLSVKVFDSENVGLPQRITEESLCPVTKCSGECHVADQIPEPDGITTMVCPKIGCASTECHAWDRLSDGFQQANSASMNLWIIAPVLFILGLVLIVRKV